MALSEKKYMPIGDNKLSSGRVLASLLLFAVLVFYLFGLTMTGNLEHRSIAVAAGILLNATIAIIFIIRDPLDFSICKIHWYFILIFFGVAAFAQYSSGYFPWNYIIQDSALIKTNLLITLWCVAFGAMSVCLEKKWNLKRTHDPVSIEGGMALCICMLVLSVVIAFYLISTLGLERLATGDGVNRETTGWLMWILSFSMPAIPAICCCVSFLYAQDRKIWIVAALVELGITILCNNPIYCSRYWVAAVYLPIILSMLPKNAFNNRKFDLFIIIALVVVFPMMNAFKTLTLDQVTLSYLFTSYAGGYNSVDFDAYSLFARIVDYSDSNGLCLGSRLFSSLAYILPGMAAQVGPATGDLVSTAQGALYTNLSAPLPAEAYIDFGYFGVIVYAVFFALAVRWLDGHFWKSYETAPTSILSVVYMVLLAFAMFIMRGALQPVVFRIEVFLLPLFVFYIAQKVAGYVDYVRRRQ